MVSVGDSCRRFFGDFRHLVTWGGGLLPAVGSLEPRIREKALYSRGLRVKKKGKEDLRHEIREIQVKRLACRTD